MTRVSKRQTRDRRAAAKTSPRRPPAPLRDPPAPPGAAAGAKRGFAEFLERAQREVLVVSLCAEHGLPDGASSATIRIKGQRLHVEGKQVAGDQFVREETIGPLPPDSGPFSITTRVNDVNPGEWKVTGEMVPRHPARGGGAHRGVTAKPVQVHPAAWSWRSRRPAPAPDTTVHTGPEVFARRPGVIPGVWAVLVALGVLAALLVQASLASRKGLDISSTLTVSSLAVIAGGIGAKAWYVILERRRRKWDGWAIQGFVVGLLAVAVLVVPIVDLRLGLYLDVTAPALLLGMSIGRVGCFFAGCCGGRPTCARHGVWSSDRRIGTRRIPTQLFESALALAVAGLAYAVVRTRTPSIEGSVFVAAVALYTLCRQVILRYRAEARHSTKGTTVTAAAASAALLGAAAMIVAG